MGGGGADVAVVVTVPVVVFTDVAVVVVFTDVAVVVVVDSGSWKNAELSKKMINHR